MSHERKVCVDILVIVETLSGGRNQGTFGVVESALAHKPPGA
jgi:hypothetical protein